jgi:hypothetical protein
MAICGNQLEIDHLLLHPAITSNRRFDTARPYHRIGSGIKENSLGPRGRKAVGLHHGPRKNNSN